MKFNIEVDLDFLNEDEGYSFNRAFKDEILRQISAKAAEIVAKQEVTSVFKDEQVQEVKKILTDEIEKLKNAEKNKIQQITEKIDDVFSDFINGISYKYNRWGEKVKEITIGEFLKEEIERQLDSGSKKLEQMIANEVAKKMALSEYNIKNLVEAESKKMNNENAKKVAEFIIKGAL